MIDRGYYLERPIKSASIEGLPSWMLADAHNQRYAVPSGAYYQNQADLYRHLSWVQASVGAVSRIAAGVAFDVKRHAAPTSQGREKLTDLPHHPFEQLLQRPNPLDSRFELMETTFAFRQLSGNAYWWLNRSSPDAPPTEIWPILPFQIQPIPDGTSYLRGYLFSPWGFYGGHLIENPPVFLELHEVVHFRSFNPGSRFLGLSPIEAIATAAEADLRAQTYNANFFAADNAKAPGALAFADPIPDSDWEKIKKDLQREHGSDKRRLLMLRGAGDGVRWLQMGLTQQEMDFLNSRTFTKEEIFAVFAPGLASAVDVNATEANSKTGKESLVEFTVWPMLTSVAEKITNDLLPAYGDNLVGSFSDIRPTDAEQRLRDIEMAARFHTVNEIRETYYSHTSIDGGDTLGGVAVRPPVSDGVKAAVVPSRLRPDEQRIADLLIPVLAQHGDRIQRAIVERRPVAYDALGQDLRRVVRPALLELLFLSVAQYEDELGVSVDVERLVPDGSDRVFQIVDILIDGLLSMTRLVVQEVIRRHGMIPDMTDAEVSTLTERVFGQRRAEVVAITETTRVYSHAAGLVQDILRSDGIALERVWKTANDEMVCRVCGPLNDAPEVVWGAQFHWGPPAHPNCRCRLALERKKED